MGHGIENGLPIDGQQWQQIDEVVTEALDYLDHIPLEEWDFDRAKAEFMRLSM